MAHMSTVCMSCPSSQSTVCEIRSIYVGDCWKQYSEKIMIDNTDCILLLPIMVLYDDVIDIHVRVPTVGNDNVQ